MIWSKVAGLALALVGGVLVTSAAVHAADASTERCVSLFTEPLGDYVRTGLGSGTTGTSTVAINLDGASTSAQVTISAVSSTRLQVVLDFGGGDMFQVGADLTPVNSSVSTFGAADSFVGAGIFAGGSANLTFQVGGLSEYITGSPASDGPNLAEWHMDGTVCFAPPPPEDEAVCANGKPATMLLRYTGEDPSASDNSQTPDKAYAIGDPAFASPVRIRVSDRRKLFDSKARVYFDALVPLNGTFTVDSAVVGDTHVRSTTVVHILDLNGNLLQYVEFHTSCSQPLFTGDQFGSIVLEDFTTELRIKGPKSAKAKKKKK